MQIEHYSINLSGTGKQIKKFGFERVISVLFDLSGRGGKTPEERNKLYLQFIGGVNNTARNGAGISEIFANAVPDHPAETVDCGRNGRKSIRFVPDTPCRNPHQIPLEPEFFLENLGS